MTLGIRALSESLRPNVWIDGTWDENGRRRNDEGGGKRIEATDIACLQVQLATYRYVPNDLCPHCACTNSHRRRERSSFEQWARYYQSFQLEVCGPSFVFR